MYWKRRFEVVKLVSYLIIYYRTIQ